MIRHHVIAAHHRLDQLTHGHARITIALVVLALILLAFVPRATAADNDARQQQLEQSYQKRVALADYISLRLQSSLQGEPYDVQKNCDQNICSVTIKHSK